MTDDEISKFRPKAKPDKSAVSESRCIEQESTSDVNEDLDSEYEEVMYPINTLMGTSKVNLFYECDTVSKTIENLLPNYSDANLAKIFYC